MKLTGHAKNAGGIVRSDAKVSSSDRGGAVSAGKNHSLLAASQSKWKRYVSFAGSALDRFMFNVPD
ncbi:MAG: hypothetical protein R3C99_17550 [Pirellulaceae bacterium]